MTNNLNVVGNITSSWFNGNVNWSDIQNAPISDWLSTYNATYDNYSNVLNETNLINSVNTTANIDALGFLNKSGTNANQDINVSPYNITANYYFGNGSQLTGIITTHNDGLYNSTSWNRTAGKVFLANSNDLVNITNISLDNIRSTTGNITFYNSTNTEIIKFTDNSEIFIGSRDLFRYMFMGS